MRTYVRSLKSGRNLEGTAGDLTYGGLSSDALRSMRDDRGTQAVAPRLLPRLSRIRDRAASWAQLRRSPRAAALDRRAPCLRKFHRRRHAFDGGLGLHEALH